MRFKMKDTKYIYLPLKGKRAQLTTTETNESRFVIKIRFAVEVVHGMIGKKHQLLHDEYSNKSLLRLESYVKIAKKVSNRRDNDK